MRREKRSPVTSRTTSTAIATTSVSSIQNTSPRSTLTVSLLLIDYNYSVGTAKCWCGKPSFCINCSSSLGRLLGLLSQHLSPE